MMVMCLLNLMKMQIKFGISDGTKKDKSCRTNLTSLNGMTILTIHINERKENIAHYIHYAAFTLGH